MQQPIEIPTEIVNEGLLGMTEYVMPIVTVLAIMAIFGFRVVLFKGAPSKNYILKSIIITAFLISLGIVLKYIDEKIAEPIISGISTIIFVLFVIQGIIQIKLKRNK